MKKQFKKVQSDVIHKNSQLTKLDITNEEIQASTKRENNSKSNPQKVKLINLQEEQKNYKSKNLQILNQNEEQKESNIYFSPNERRRNSNNLILEDIEGEISIKQPAKLKPRGNKNFLF